jgi:hypothetical protein
LYSPSPQFASAMARHLAPTAQAVQAHAGVDPHKDNVSKNATASQESPCSTTLSPPGRSDGGDRSRSEPPSVVKHLRGRFESHKPLMFAEGEVGARDSEIASAFHVHFLPPGTLSLDQDRGDNRVSPLPKWRSLDEHGQAKDKDSHVGMMDTTPPPPLQGQVRRPRSAEPTPLPHPSLRHSSSANTSRTHTHTPWEGPAGAGEEGFEGAKVRRVHGKSHPLSRLHYQGQGQGVPPMGSIQRHGPFHSSM